MGYIICGIFILFIVAAIYHKIYSMFDHTGWKAPNQPDPYAQIVDFKTERQKLSKTEYKMNSVVTFSDGFYFETYDTDCENHLFTYTISIDTERILRDAVSAHNKEIKRKTGVAVPENYFPDIRISRK